MTDKLTPVRCGCGGEAVLNTGKIITATGEHLANVKCKKCGIAIPVKVSLDQSEAKSEAITAWNKAMGNRMELQTVEPAKVIEHDASVTDTDGYKYHRSEYLCGACKKKVIGGDDYCSHCGIKLDWSGNE